MGRSLSALCLLFAGNVLAGDLFSFGTSAPTDEKVLATLKQAEADFHAVEEGKRPIYAAYDQDAPLPTDGGTIFYKAEGYSLVVVKSLQSMGGVHGYMYGPVLKLSPRLSVGNYPQVSHITFYSSAAFTVLMGGGQ